jgi:hypothetical protein
MTFVAQGEFPGPTASSGVLLSTGGFSGAQTSQRRMNDVVRNYV